MKLFCLSLDLHPHSLSFVQLAIFNPTILQVHLIEIDDKNVLKFSQHHDFEIKNMAHFNCKLTQNNEKPTKH